MLQNGGFSATTSESGRASGSLKTGKRSHPVSQLQEYCQKRKIFAPYYHYFQEVNSSMELTFTCVCRLNSYNLEVRQTKRHCFKRSIYEIYVISIKYNNFETDNRNQKDARRAAASLMLKELMSIQSTQEVLY